MIKKLVHNWADYGRDFLKVHNHAFLRTGRDECFCGHLNDQHVRVAVHSAALRVVMLKAMRRLEREALFQNKHRFGFESLRPVAQTNEQLLRLACVVCEDRTRLLGAREFGPRCAAPKAAMCLAATPS